MNANAAAIADDIGSLDLVTTSDAPDRWRPACERLRSALALGRRARRRFMPLAGVIAVAWFAIHEGPMLDERAYLLLAACAIAGGSAWTFRNHPIGEKLWLATIFVMAVAAYVVELHGYFFLAYLTGVVINAILARYYPALS